MSQPAKGGHGLKDDTGMDVMLQGKTDDCMPESQNHLQTWSGGAIAQLKLAHSFVLDFCQCRNDFYLSETLVQHGQEVHATCPRSDCVVIYDDLKTRQMDLARRLSEGVRVRHSSRAQEPSDSAPEGRSLPGLESRAPKGVGGFEQYSKRLAQKIAKAVKKWHVAT
jgi:hypothetical protein